MRDIKFREYRGNAKFHYWGLMEEGKFIGPCSPNSIAQQFTGLYDKNGTPIFEGDIFRIEESGDVDVEDQMFYIVIVWIKEWCMFGSLSVQSEYQKYLRNGIEELDEPMFWTYSLEDTNSLKHFLCGDIYTTPELLKP